MPPRPGVSGDQTQYQFTQAEDWQSGSTAINDGSPSVLIPSGQRRLAIFKEIRMRADVQFVLLDSEGAAWQIDAGELFILPVSTDGSFEVQSLGGAGAVSWIGFGFPEPQTTTLINNTPG